MDLGIGGLRVLVTAAASGIGAEIAGRFAAEGAQVWVCDLDDAALDRFLADSPDIGGAPCDVADRGAVGTMFEAALAALGGLDCLVNNAGIAGPTGPVDEVDPTEWDRCISVCLNSQYYCTRLAVDPLRRSTNASIVNLSSSAGKFGFPYRSAYAAAKWGVIGFTKSVSRELGHDGIRCNAILPGIVEGPRIDRVIAAKAASLGSTPEAVRDTLLGHCSIPEMVRPEQLADVILFLASTRARTISGQAISVDADLQTLI